MDFQVTSMPRIPLHKKTWPQRKLRLPPDLCGHLEEIAKAPGISKKLAELIYAVLHSE